MKTCSLSLVKRRVPLAGWPIQRLTDTLPVISRGGKLLILQAYEPPNPAEFDALIDEGINAEHVPLTDAVWEGVRWRAANWLGSSGSDLLPSG